MVEVAASHKYRKRKIARSRLLGGKLIRFDEFYAPIFDILDRATADFNGIWEIKPHKHHALLIVPLIPSYPTNPRLESVRCRSEGSTATAAAAAVASAV
jgi:hypothetical protein